MRETKFEEMFNELDRYYGGLTAEEKKVEFNFGDELHRELLTWSDDFTFAHFTLGQGSMTVGGTRVGDRLYYAVALCSPQDNFSKAKGRAYVRDHLSLAEHNKKRGVFTLHPENYDLPPPVILKGVADDYLSKMRHKPEWAKGENLVFRTERRMNKKNRKNKALL